MHACMCVCVSARMHAYTHVRMHACMHAHPHTCTTHTHTHKHIDMYYLHITNNSYTSTVYISKCLKFFTWENYNKER